MPKVRSIFLSDIHLGTRACQAQCLLEFLREYDSEYLFLAKYHRWAAVLGDKAYAFAVRLNAMVSWIRRRLGIAGYWSLAGYAKRKVKSAVSFIFDFEESVARYVKERGVDGVICGHIHAAAIKEVGGIRYINCGDWVDSCAAILEYQDGRMELLEWGVGPRQVDGEEAHRVEPSWEPGVTEPLRTPTDSSPALQLQPPAASGDRARRDVAPQR